MAEAQERGRLYRRPVVAELKKLQASRRLIPEGTPVIALLHDSVTGRKRS
jgi:hypothetical protein